MYVPGKLFVRGNAAATASNIAAGEWVFRLGIVSQLVAGVVLIFLTMALYRLFKDVDRNLAVLMVITGGIIPAVLDFVMAVHDAAALILIRAPEFLAVFEQAQREAMAVFFLRLHHQQVLAAEILWGVWLFPLAALTYRSRFMPRFLAVLLGVNGIAYVVISLTGFLLPQREKLVSDVLFPALLGEVVFVLWLVIRGAGAANAPPASPASPAAEPR